MWQCIGRNAEKEKNTLKEINRAAQFVNTKVESFLTTNVD